jgi:hypothetical protein
MSAHWLFGCAIFFAFSSAQSQPTASARIADDGVSVEFVFNNPDSQAYVCSAVGVSVRYSAGTNEALAVDVRLGPDSQNIVIPQSNESIAELRRIYNRNDLKAEAILGQVVLPPTGCEIDRSGKVYALAIDDRTGCSDPRQIMKLFSVNPGLQTLSFASAPIALAAPMDKWLAHSFGQPVFYGLRHQTPRQLTTWRIEESGMQTLGSMALPDAPTGAIVYGGEVRALPLAGWTMLDSETLLAAYVSGMVDDPAGPVARVFFDVVKLDNAGIPLESIRHTLNVLAISSAELFVAQSVHRPGTVLLYLSAAPVRHWGNSGNLFDRQPVDLFPAPRDELAFYTQVSRIDGIKQAGQWKFTTKSLPMEDPRVAAKEFVASGAHRPVGLTGSGRIGSLALTRAGSAGGQYIQVWSVPTNTASVLAHSTSPDFCNVLILPIDTRTYASGNADMNRQDAAGKTAVHIAVEKGDKASLEALLRKKPALNIRDKEQHTPLMRALHAGRADLLSLLIKAGADVSLPVPDLSGTMFAIQQSVISKACDECIAPLSTVGVSWKKITLPDGRTGEFKDFLCAQIGQDQAGLARYIPPPPPLPESADMRQWKAEAQRRVKISTTLNIDCAQR